MPVLEPNVTIIGLGHVEHPVLFLESTVEEQSNSLSLPNTFRHSAENDEEYWNNRLRSKKYSYPKVTNNRDYGNITKTDFYNHINRRLTLDFHNSSSNLLTTVPQPSRSHSISVTPRSHTTNLLNEDINSTKEKINFIEQSSNLISSTIDIVNMGKIQEFREKVGVKHVAMPRKDIWRCLIAEFLGTFLLVLIGCGSSLSLTGADKPTLLGVALCFALMVATLAAAIGHVSGCHINPAVTLAMLVTGKIELVKASLYIVVQCVAAIVGIGILKVLSPTPIEGQILDFGYTKLAANLTPIQGFAIEFMLTFLLVFIIFAVCDENRTDLKGSGPLAIGLSLAAIILYGGPLTGAGLNPARVLGPCVILGKFEDHWIYWIGPIGGALAAALLYQNIFRALRADEVEAAEIAFDRKIREKEMSKENGVSP